MASIEDMEVKLTFDSSEVVESLNLIIKKIDDVTNRISVLEDVVKNIQPQQKVYAFPVAPTLQKWVKEFGPSAVEAGINTQLIVNIVQACGLVLGTASDKDTFPAPSVKWMNDSLRLTFEKGNTSLSLFVGGSPYPKIKWKMAGDDPSFHREEEIGKPVSADFVYYVRSIG